MSFKKYASIENSYRQKFIDKFLNDDIQNVRYVVREKLDGANIQLLFTPRNRLQVGKRTSFLSTDESFFDIWNTLAKYAGRLDNFQTWVNYDDDIHQIRVFGEIYGPGINKRIDYGTEKRIAIFDIYLTNNLGEERLLTQKELEQYMNVMEMGDLLAPLVGYYDTLDAALAVEVERPDKPIEGVVIQPYDKILRQWNGAQLILKKKSKAFEDKREEDINAGQPKERTIIDELNSKFKGYITKNRILDVFAKYGEIKEMGQIGDYIGFVLEDAKADFLKDNDLAILVPNLDKKQEKNLYNVGSMIVTILKGYL